jgi:hypothetical protein
MRIVVTGDVVIVRMINGRGYLNKSAFVHGRMVRHACAAAVSPIKCLPFLARSDSGRGGLLTVHHHGMFNFRWAALKKKKKNRLGNTRVRAFAVPFLICHSACSSCSRQVFCCHAKWQAGRRVC